MGNNIFIPPIFIPIIKDYPSYDYFNPKYKHVLWEAVKYHLRKLLDSKDNLSLVKFIPADIFVLIFKQSKVDVYDPIILQLKLPIDNPIYLLWIRFPNILFSHSFYSSLA